MCDFEGLRPPEMTKKRQVIVLSPRSRDHNPDTFLVVPVSKSPHARSGSHCEFKPRSYHYFDSVESVWALTDMVTCVARWRLDRILVNRRHTCVYVRPADLLRVRRAVLYSLGMSGWNNTGDAPDTTVETKRHEVPVVIEASDKD